MKDANHAAVEKVIEHYFAGLQHGDVESLKRAFHPAAKLYRVDDSGQLKEISQAQWYTVVIPRAPAAPAGDHIVSLDVSGNAALVKTRVEFRGAHYVDYLSLLKLADGWKIVSKTFCVAD